MKNALKALCCVSFLAAGIFIWSCGPNAPNTNNSNAGNTNGSGPSTAVVPAPFPDPGIPGFKFPEQAAVIDGWAKDGKNEDIYKHGWGIWAGLTTDTKQVPPGGTQSLLVFETWQTPAEIIAAINNDQKKMLAARSNRSDLIKPHQFAHALAKGDKKFAAKPAAKTDNTNTANTKPANTNTGGKPAPPAPAATPDQNLAVSVSYSPPAAKYATDNKIFLYDTLKGYGDGGKTDIPPFPSDAITLKPTFKVISKSALGSNGLYVLAAWHGPDEPTPSPNGYAEIDWKSCVYVDINNKGKGDGSQDPTCSNPTPATTYNLSDFISYTLNKEDADFYNQEFGLTQDSGGAAQAGDSAILVAMHVATRETVKWTWQSYYWASNPADPKAPSSAEIAKLRPSQITGAAAHYSMTVAYAMVFPAQPDTGGQSVGDPIYGFNPYLEAGFGNSVFTGSNSVVKKDGKDIATNFGVRTNCMSCHVYASVLGSNPCQSNTPYSGDAYVSLDDPIFKSQVKLDFAWSIQGNVQKDGKPCPPPAQ